MRVPAARSGWRQVSAKPSKASRLQPQTPSTPGQIVVAQGQVTITLASDLKDRIGNAGLQRGAAIMAHATQPMPGLEEGDVDVRRIFLDARQRESVEVVLGDAPVYDVALLMHGVVVEPGDLAFELFAHR